jgi:hypothetical protein
MRVGDALDDCPGLHPIIRSAITAKLRSRIIVLQG